jgi:hypothetical protein
MNPIFEQRKGKGVGYSGISAFHARFEHLCEARPERAFAFIFYDFKSDLKKVLKDQGVFAQLGRLSGDWLDIFYLHSCRSSRIERFDETILKTLGIDDASIPCIVFFRWKDGAFTDILVVPLESASLMHGFQELHAVIDAYKAKRKPPTQENGALKYFRWIPGALRFVTQEAVKAALKGGMDHLPPI